MDPRSNRKRTISPELKYFPPELWTDVLVRLPVKSLLRFKCVSKTLRNIIDDPTFIHLHRRLFNQKTHFYVLETDTIRGNFKLTIYPSDIFTDTTTKLDNRSMTITIELPDHSHGIRYISEAMSHELVLLRKLVRDVDNKPWPCYSKCLEDRLILWSPCAQKFLLLPLLPNPFPDNRGYYHTTNIHHDWGDDGIVPDVRFFRYALGFAPSVNDFKVLAFRCDNCDYLRRQSAVLSTSVYSLANGFWKTKSSTLDSLCMWWDRQDKSTLLLGGANWLARDRSTNRGYTHVIWFDFDEKEFKQAKLPDELLEGEGEMLVFSFLLGAALAVLGVSPVTTCIYVMEKEGYGGKGLWTKRYSGVSKLSFYEAFKLWYHCDCVILYLENSDVLLVKTSGSMIFYNMKDREIHHHEMHRVFADWWLSTYLESLVLTKAIEGRTSSSFP